MNKKLLVVYAILVVLLIVVFLFTPYHLFGWSHNPNYGIDCLTKGTPWDDGWHREDLYIGPLAILMPVLALLALFRGSKTRLVAALGTLLPTILGIQVYSQQYYDFGIGFFLCVALQVILIVVAFWEVITTQKE